MAQGGAGCAGYRMARTARIFLSCESSAACAVVTAHYGDTCRNHFPASAYGHASHSAGHVGDDGLFGGGSDTRRARFPSRLSVTSACRLSTNWTPTLSVPLWPNGALRPIHSRSGGLIPRALVFRRPPVEGKCAVSQILRKTSIPGDRMQQFNDVIVDR